jgi:hypothetical protein
VLLALLVAGAAFAAVVLLGGAGGHHGSGGGSPGSGAAVPLHGLTTYDPQGDGSEQANGNITAPRATDGNPATYWSTETYNTEDWGNLKSGLGLVLDAGHAVKLSTITVETQTPGFVARIEVGDSPNSFAIDSSSQTVGTRTTFALSGKSGRYWMVWLSRLGPQRTARVTEVKARS